MIVESGTCKYRVGAKVAETDLYRVYLCQEVDNDKPYLLQIVSGVAHNGSLERATYVLKELKQTADLFEAEYAKTGSGRLLSYDRLFPLMVDGFIAEDQGGRRVNILAFTEVDDVKQMVPLSNLVAKDHLRVDLRSSAWIMGRLLKLLGLAHGDGIAVGSLTAANILLEPQQHFAVVFDWSSAQMHQTGIPVEIRKDDIAGAAKAVFAAIGGDPITGNYPYDSEEFGRYVECLWRLASRREHKADRAHAQFYELVEELWGRTFVEFTTLPL